MTNEERNQIAEKNLNLVWLVINKLHYNLDKDDQFQNGCIGLMKAIEDYNPDLGYAFSTYATTTIEYYIKKDAFQEFERRSHQVSLDAPIPGATDEEGNTKTLYDVLADQVNIEEIVENKYIADQVIGRLRPLEREILTMRFLEGKSLREIASAFNLTLEALRRIEGQALRTCRKHKEDIEEEL